jgi:hypothetical protein
MPITFPISPLFDDGEMGVTPLTLGRFRQIWYQMKGKTMLFPMVQARVVKLQHSNQRDEKWH